MLLSLAAFFQIAATGQDFSWAKQLTGSSLDLINAMDIDDSNNILIGGIFNNEIDMDPGPAEVILEANAGFLGKYDDAGELIWAFRSEDRVDDAVFDNDGSVYATGRFSGTVDFDPSEDVFELTAQGLEDAFLAKYDEEGEFIFALSIAGEEHVYGLALATDNNNDVLLTGSYEEMADFDPSGEGFFLTSDGSTDIFIAKYSNTGSFLWAGSVGGTNQDIPHAIATDPEGNVLVTGEFRESGDFDPGTSFEIIEGVADEDIFVLKLDSSGEFEWVNAMVGSDEDIGFAIQTDVAGNVYTAGRFENWAEFDGPNLELEAEGCYDVYVQKFNPDGSTDWLRQLGGNNCSYLEDMKLDPSGDLYLVGYFSGTMDFDPSPENADRTSNGGNDIYICKLSGSGQYQWATSFGGPGTFDQDRGEGIAVDQNGFVYAVGDFENVVDFDPGTGEFFMEANGSDGFIWKGTGGALSSADLETLKAIVFPNPTSGEVLLEIPANFNPTSATLVDMKGRRVEQITDFNDRLLRFEITGEPGIYLVEVNGKDGTKMVAKVVKR